MTNIMAVIRNKNPEVKDDEHNQAIGIVMADGLASGGREKSRGNQKVFPIGPHYLLGTGPGDKIVFMAEALYKHRSLSPEELAKKTYDIIKEYFVDPAEPLSFIVAGRGDKQLELYHCVTDRFKVPRKCSNAVFDGSGSEFVSKAAQRDQERGIMVLDFNDGTLADLTTDLWDFGYVATKSAGVNNEFQFGFLLPEGSATLLHPNTSVRFPTKEYMDEQGSFSKEKWEQNAKIYGELNNLLYESFKLTVACNSITQRLMGNRLDDPQKVHRELDEKVTELHNVKKDITRVITDYVTEHGPVKNQDPAIPTFQFKGGYCI